MKPTRTREEWEALRRWLAKRWARCEGGDVVRRRRIAALIIEAGNRMTHTGEGPTTEGAS